ncbi:MAG: sodium:proton antiporter [Halomonas sp.]|uniref:nickel/cobalt transporter n=1 Tax=Halomonas sp. TaxID=1486246 RepID=UPI002ACE417B|nr:sodium:proton antiporter [Halomonas sp.]MDZ7851917.1 sodium:proton antiporter [Halomonas sp.]
MPLTLTRLAWLAAGLLTALLVWQLVFQGGLQGISLQLMAWQRDFHRALTMAITGLSGTPSPATWTTLLGISFGYGVFHAAGPGHGKAVLTTYLVSHGGARRRALALSCAASLLQGLVAISLVVLLVHGLGWLTRQAMGSVAWVEQASFIMVALLGAWLCLRAIRQLRASAAVAETASGKAHTHHHLHAHDQAHDCCGGHLVDPQRTEDWRTALATVVAIGIRPCSGAVLLLGAATLLGNFMVGVAAVVVMSLGTALTVSTLALASVFARGWAERRLASRITSYGFARLLGWGSLTGGLAILALGICLTLTGVGSPSSSTLLGEPPPRSATAAPDAAPPPFGG